MGVGNKWEEVIYPGMKSSVINTLIATQERSETRKASFYSALFPIFRACIGQIMYPICFRCGNGREVAESLFLFCPKLAAKSQWYFADFIDITDVISTVKIWWIS